MNNSPAYRDPNQIIMQLKQLYRRGAAALLFAVPLFAIVFAAGCAEADGAESSEAVQQDSSVASAPRRFVRVETTVAEPQTFEERIQLTGTVEAIDDVTISAETSGRVEYIADLGTEVSAGAVVARFDDRLLKSQTAAAEAEYRLAADTFERQKALFADSIISALEFESAQARRDQAEANYTQAKKMFEDTQLQSPIAGRVEARYIETGELVNPGMPVARVVNSRHVKVTAGVPERYAADISEGASVKVRLRAVGLEGDAEVSFVGRVVNPQSRTFPVEIKIDNESGLLKPEMVADVSIERRVLENAIVVPQNALVHDDLGTSIFVVEESNGDLIARRRNVTVGASFGGQTVVISGVERGDQVVVVGQSNLTDGNLVEVQGA